MFSLSDERFLEIHINHECVERFEVVEYEKLKYLLNRREDYLRLKNILDVWLKESEGKTDQEYQAWLDSKIFNNYEGLNDSISQLKICESEKDSVLNESSSIFDKALDFNDELKKEGEKNNVNILESEKDSVLNESSSIFDKAQDFNDELKKEGEDNHLNILEKKVSEIESANKVENKTADQKKLVLGDEVSTNAEIGQNAFKKNNEKIEKPCENPGCKNETKMVCSICLNKKLPDASYCSQECFKACWNTHKLVHSTNNTVSKPAVKTENKLAEIIESCVDLEEYWEEKEKMFDKQILPFLKREEIFVYKGKKFTVFDIIITGQPSITCYCQIEPSENNVLAKYYWNHGRVIFGEFKRTPFTVDKITGKCLTNNMFILKMSGNGKISSKLDQAVYYGEIENGVSNGKGKLRYNSGKMYIGEFKNGTKSGYGEMTFTDIDFIMKKFSGEWNDDNPINGEIIYSDGGKYTGGVNCDFERHGKGKITLLRGNKYVGDFEDDKFHGKGEYTWANGDRYNGELKNDKVHGKGEYSFWLSGIKYKGQFKHGYIDGQGLIIGPNGEQFTQKFTMQEIPDFEALAKSIIQTTRTDQNN